MLSLGANTLSKIRARSISNRFDVLSGRRLRPTRLLPPVLLSRNCAIVCGADRVPGPVSGLPHLGHHTQRQGGKTPPFPSCLSEIKQSDLQTWGGIAVNVLFALLIDGRGVTVSKVRCSCCRVAGMSLLSFSVASKRNFTWNSFHSCVWWWHFSSRLMNLCLFFCACVLLT